MPFREKALKLRAAEILGMLPDDAAEARRVMEYLRWLLDAYLGQSSGSSPNLRAIVNDKSPITPSSIHPVDKPLIR